VGLSRDTSGPTACIVLCSKARDLPFRTGQNKAKIYPSGQLFGLRAAFTVNISCFGGGRDLARQMFRTFAVLAAMMSCLSFPAAAQSGRKFYIDYSSGSNSNPGTEAAPWKSHPYMQTGSGCTGTGGAPAYSHQAGDQFIFKGGVTWPAACFSFNIVQGGNSSIQDYYGVDKTWYNGSSFTRPVFDMGNSEPNGNTVIQAGPLTGGTYVTLDNFEIKGQSIDLSAAASQASYGSGCGILLNTYNHGGSENLKSGAGTVVSNVFIHDWAGKAGQSMSSYNLSEGCFGGVQGAETLVGTTISDQNGKADGSVLTWGGGCHYCANVSNSHFAYGWFGDVYFSGASNPVHISHDNEFDHLNQNVSGTSNPNVHTHVIYDNQSVALGGGGVVYNNALHDNLSGILIFIGYNTDFYNNVVWNNQNGTILNPFGGSGDSSGNVGHWYNNTMDTAGGGSTSCLIERQASGYSGGSIQGNFNYKNNICIGSSQGGGQWSGGSINFASNYTMGSTEQNTYGFTSANKYASTSSDPNVVGKGTNLASTLSLLSSSFLSALQYDAAGAPWFGRSYNQRSSTWDLGAFANGAQSSSSAPNPPSNLSAIVQ
jgi:hypothetical protein